LRGAARADADEHAIAKIKADDSICAERGVVVVGETPRYKSAERSSSP
jgi:hypothetical protein